MTRLAPRTIHTGGGPLQLIPATVDQVRDIARYWPMEIVTTPETPGQFGLVFQRGDQEVHGIKLQPVDLAASKAKTIHHINRALIAAGLPYYLEKRHEGVMVPCAYYKEKSAELAESGIALFVGPDPGSAARSQGSPEGVCDDRLGVGATAMILDMAGAIAEASRKLNLPMMTLIGMDVRPRLAIGGLAMHFVIVGQQIFVVKDPLDESEQVWEYLVRAGFSTLPYAPMRPAGLPDGVPPPDIQRI